MVMNVSRYNLSELQEIYTAAAWATDHPDGKKVPKWFVPEL